MIKNQTNRINQYKAQLLSGFKKYIKENCCKSWAKRYAMNYINGRSLEVYAINTHDELFIQEFLVQMSDTGCQVFVNGEQLVESSNKELLNSFSNIRSLPSTRLLQTVQTALDNVARCKRVTAAA